MKRAGLLLVLIILICTLCGCQNIISKDSEMESLPRNTSLGNGSAEPITTKGQESDAIDNNAESEIAEQSGTDKQGSIAPSEKATDITELVDISGKPNEAGEVMIIMYHNLASENSTYARTVESFKNDLQVLYEMGFVSVSMRDYIDGEMDIPAGRTPVVLTFDDGHISNFRYLEDSSIDPDCVVGILNDFAETHPEFGRNAIFYLNGGYPFGQPEFVRQKLEYLLSNGYEIGNHSFGHENLSKLDEQGVMEALGKNINYYEDITSQRMYSLALPYGIAPKSEFADAAVKGEYEGREYIHESVLLVGWRPTYPFYSTYIDKSAIHRVQSGDGEMQLTWWLNNYKEKPELRYFSDGVAGVVSVPVGWAEGIDSQALEQKGKKILIYE